MQKIQRIDTEAVISVADDTPVRYIRRILGGEQEYAYMAARDLILIMRKRLPRRGDHTEYEINNLKEFEVYIYSCWIKCLIPEEKITYTISFQVEVSNETKAQENFVRYLQEEFAERLESEDLFSNNAAKFLGHSWKRNK